MLLMQFWQATHYNVLPHRQCNWQTPVFASIHVAAAAFRPQDALVGRLCLSVYVVVAAAQLRNALEARTAEAALYRKQYNLLSRKLDSLEEQQRQASFAARDKVKNANHHHHHHNLPNTI